MYIQLPVRYQMGSHWETKRFSVISTHSTQKAARKKGAYFRKQGCLARVRPYGSKFQLCIRKPRLKAPGRKDLVC